MLVILIFLFLYGTCTAYYIERKLDTYSDVEYVHFLDFRRDVSVFSLNERCALEVASKYYNKSKIIVWTLGPRSVPLKIENRIASNADKYFDMRRFTQALSMFPVFEEFYLAHVYKYVILLEYGGLFVDNYSILDNIPNLNKTDVHNFDGVYSKIAWNAILDKALKRIDKEELSINWKFEDVVKAEYSVCREHESEECRYLRFYSKLYKNPPIMQVMCPL